MYNEGRIDEGGSRKAQEKAMSPGRHAGHKQVLARMGKFVSAGWFVQGDEVSNQSRKALIFHNLTASLIANLTGGSFFTGLLIVLQADDAFVGLITMITFGANLLQLLAPYILERFTRRKPILIAVKLFIHLVNIAFVGLIPFLPAAQQTRLVFLGFSIFLVNALNAFIGPGFSVWHIAHVPPKVRVQYFSLVSMLNGVLVAVFNLLSSGVVDLFRAKGQELTGLSLLRAAALVVAVVDILLLLRIKELPLPKASKKIGLRSLLRLTWRYPVYLRSVLVVVLWSLVANMPGSFYSVYLLRELGINYSTIMQVAAFNVVVLVSTTFIWRKIYLKHSWLRPLGLAIMATAPHYFILAFVSKNLLFLYPLGILWSFLCACGINMAFSSVAFINLPADNQTMHLAFYSTANFLAALAAATLGRTFVTRLSGLRYSLLGVPFGEKQTLMLVVGSLLFLVGLAVLHLARLNNKQGLEH